MRGVLTAVIAALSILLNGCETSGLTDASVVLIETARGRGTGFFIGDGRIIVTAAHVVGSASVVTVRAGGRRASAAVLRSDRERDVAVLVTGLRGRGLSISCGRAAPYTSITVAGHPLGWTHPVYSVGRVSGRHIVAGDSMVPVDIMIAPGHSGSPAVHNGRVVGVMVAMAAIPGYVTNIALMVPGDIVCASIDGAFEG